MKIFVTGGAGFIGSHLVDRLVAEGHTVTVYDNLTSGKREFIAHHLDSGEQKVTLVEADCRDLEKLTSEIAGHDAVCHLAANPDARLGNIQTDLDLQLETIATYNVLEAMRRNNIKHIILTSSGTIYGEVPVEPIAEDFGPTLPISLYGAGKVASEALCSAFVGTFGFQAHIFRFVNIIGGRATHGVIYDFINKLIDNPHELEVLGDGTQEKPYLLVEECVDGIIFALRNSDEPINVFNLGHPSSTTVNQIANIVKEEMGLVDAELKYTGGDRGWQGDVPQYRADVSKINKLGWFAQHTSDEAVRETVRRILKEKNYQSTNVLNGEEADFEQKDPAAKIEQLVILAGGLATRLYPITLKTPKSLVTILGKPFIEYQLELAKANGISKVVMCVGHMGDEIEKYLGDGTRYGMKIDYSYETEKLDTGGALRNALPFLDEIFFVMYGDSFLLGDWQKFGTYLLNEPEVEGAMALWLNPDGRLEPPRIIINGKYVQEYRKEPPPEKATHSEWGLNVFRKNVISQEPDGCYPISRFFDQLIPFNKMLGVETNQRFFEIGCTSGLKDTQRLLTIHPLPELIAKYKNQEIIELPK